MKTQAHSILLALAAEQARPLIFATVSGSHLYGFSSPDSDFDLRGVHVLAPAEVVGLETGPETIEQALVRDKVELNANYAAVKAHVYGKAEASGPAEKKD